MITPTTGEVCRAYKRGVLIHRDRPRTGIELDEEFDRWLRKVQQDSFNEGRVSALEGLHIHRKEGS